jgi:hypothetical protein
VLTRLVANDMTFLQRDTLRKETQGVSEWVAKFCWLAGLRAGFVVL